MLDEQNLYNPYVGMGNNPVGNVDPMGLDTVKNIGGAAYWIPQVEGWAFDTNLTGHKIALGPVKNGQIQLDSRFGGGSISLAKAYTIAEGHAYTNLLSRRTRERAIARAFVGKSVRRGEAKMWAVARFPKYLWQTTASGETADSLAGTLEGMTDQLNPFGGGLGFNPIFGHQKAYEEGKVVGQVTGFTMNVVMAVSGVTGVVKAVGAIKGAGGLIQGARMVTNTGQVVNLVWVNGKAVPATAKLLGSLGISLAAFKNALDAGKAGGAASGGGGVKLTSGGRKVLKNLKGMKDMKVADAIRARGGGAGQVKQVATNLQQETVGSVANMAAKGDRAAQTAIKMIKQAADKAGKYGGK